MTIHRIRICKCGHEEAEHDGNGCHYGKQLLGRSIHGGCDCTGFRSRKVLGKKRTPAQAKLPATPLAALKVAMEFMILAVAMMERETKSAVSETIARKSETKPIPREMKHPGLHPDDRPNAVERTYKPGGKKPKGTIAILTAIVQHNRTGITREHLTILTGYKRSTRDAYIQRLRTGGTAALVKEEDGLIWPTQEGIRELGSFEPLPTGKALREYWMNRLPKGERAIFEALVWRHPTGLSREDLSTETGFKASTRNAYIQRLITRKLVIDSGRSVIVASKELFT